MTPQSSLKANSLHIQCRPRRVRDALVLSKATVTTGHGGKLLVRHWNFADRKYDCELDQTDTNLPATIVFIGRFAITDEALEWCQKTSVNTVARDKPTIPGIAVVKVNMLTGAYDILVQPTWTQTPRALYPVYQVHCMPPPHGGDLYDTVGLEIHRDIIAEKTRREIDCIATNGDIFSGDSLPRLEFQLHRAKRADSHEVIRDSEKESARNFWREWNGLELFTVKNGTRVNDRWVRFWKRTSPLTGQRQHAADPYNALINFAYTVATAESALALRCVGLNPQFGIEHELRQDTRSDPLAYDLVEVIRPTVLSWVLDYFRAEEFGRHDFFTQKNSSVVRVGNRVKADVAGQAHTWFMELAPHAENIAQRIDEAIGTGRKKFVRPITRTEKKKGGKRAVS